MAVRMNDHRRYKSNYEAEYISFDAVPAGGVLHDCFHVELAARRLLPTSDGFQPEFEIVAHLRCTMQVAIELRDCLDRMINRKETDRDPITQSAKLN